MESSLGQAQSRDMNETALLVGGIATGLAYYRDKIVSW